MLAWHIGVRYLRRRRAAWLALAAITLTVAAPVAVVGVMQGFVDATARQARASESDITLQSRRVQEHPELVERIRRTDGVVDVAPFVSQFVLASSRGGAEVTPCQLDGIDFAADVRIARLDQSQLHPRPAEDLSSPPLKPSERGSGFLTRAWREQLALASLAVAPSLGLGPAPVPPVLRPPPGVIAGRELVYVNGMYTGMRIDLVGTSLYRQQVEISDTVGTGIVEVDQTTMLVPLPIAQAIAGYLDRRTGVARVDGWRVDVAPDQELDPVGERLEAATGMHPWTWLQRRANQIRAFEVQRNVLGFVMLAIQLITIFAVYAVFSTLVAEKRHDIGVLLGIGARRGQIAATFLMAGVTACVSGGLLGWALGWGILLALKILSDSFGLLIFPQNIFYSPQTPISWDPTIPLFFIGAMTVIGLLAVAIPAWRASRIEPVDILREGG